MKQTVSERALALVEQKLPTLEGRLTPQDAAGATGVTVAEARDALTRLMELYVTRVTHDEQGNVLFAFEMPLRRRGTKTAAEKWAEVKTALWRGFKVFFKIWIGLMVIVYFAIMVVVLIALVLAQKSSDNDDDDGPGMIGGLFHVLAEGLRFAFWTNVMTADHDYATDRHGYRYREVRTPRGRARGHVKEKSFIIAIYDLALGPERAPADPLENEREIAAFLRAERGVLTPAEILALSGGTIADAEERMADYLVRFNGEPAITDEGAVVGEFEAFVSGASKDAGGSVVPYWEEFEAPFEHSGNTAGRNTVIILMVLFTAVMGMVLLGGGLDALASTAGPFWGGGLAAFLLGYMPVAFSLLYLGISLVRYLDVRRLEAARLERNRRKMVMRAIFQGRLWSAKVDQIYFAMLAHGEKDLSKAELETIIRSLLPDLQGDIELDEEGEPVYTFPRLQREYESAERLRGRTASGL
ncbi:MAG TPA: hypothetical protein VNA88_14695 [Candidatus Kapabacteria bacterium]|nr:hypothetical protein [Candidatus Kapabacteria bacterium]